VTAAERSRAYVVFTDDSHGRRVIPGTTAMRAHVVWTDNRDVDPTLNANEDADATTDPPALINARLARRQIYLDTYLAAKRGRIGPPPCTSAALSSPHRVRPRRRAGVRVEGTVAPLLCCCADGGEAPIGAPPRIAPSYR
jgi:hypothetical protein